jgi:hypothetical protein
VHFREQIARQGARISALRPAVRMPDHELIVELLAPLALVL